VQAASWKKRLKMLWRIAQCFGAAAAAPLLSGTKVELVHTLIADALTSSCVLLWDIESTVCSMALNAPQNHLGTSSTAVDSSNASSGYAPFSMDEAGNLSSVASFFGGAANQTGAVVVTAAGSDVCGADSWHDTNIKPLVYLLPFWIRFMQCITIVCSDPVSAPLYHAVVLTRADVLACPRLYVL
jgi:hypothetical protein